MYRVNTECLDQKSDVFSFGVVLLQIITGQPATSGTQHVKDWVRSVLANGHHLTSIVDQRLQGDFEINSITDVINIAMECVSHTPSDRPDMSKILATLKNCLAEELAARNYNSVTESMNSSKVVSEINATSSEVSPLAK